MLDVRQDADVSVVVPVYENAATLPELERRVRTALAGRRVRIVMVDDASPDDARAVIRRLPVECIAQPKNRGQNAAIWAGLRAAREPVSCVLDADLQDPPEALKGMLDRLARGDVGVVFASRDTSSPATSKLFRWLMQRLFPSLPRKPCLFFVIDAPTREALCALATERDYVVAAIGALGVRTAVFQAARAPRPAGHSAYGTLGRVRYAARALSSAARLRARRMSFRREPPGRV